MRDVFNNPRNKGQIGGIFLFLFKHLSWSTNVLGTINHFQNIGNLIRYLPGYVKCRLVGINRRIHIPRWPQFWEFKISAVMTLAGGLGDPFWKRLSRHGLLLRNPWSSWHNLNCRDRLAFEFLGRNFYKNILNRVQNMLFHIRERT